MGRILSDWIDATTWMPRLHTRDEDMGFCLHLLDTTDVLILSVRDQVAGFLSLKGHEIQALYLSPDARGLGHGKALVDLAKAASEGRLGLWTFQANVRARQFYLREGFVETRRSDGAGNDEGLPDIRFDWRRA